jgi:deoxyribodipyrimidine photolyase
VDARPAGVLFWFRHDLRLHDQPALHRAIALAQATGGWLLPL